mgnify:CR=1 FL=1
MDKIPTILLIMYTILINSTQTTIVDPTTNEILFKPLGQLIPELSWATVRIRLNITDMFKETIHLCKAAKLMDKQYVRNKEKYRSEEHTSELQSQ